MSSERQSERRRCAVGLINVPWGIVIGVLSFVMKWVDKWNWKYRWNSAHFLWVNNDWMNKCSPNVYRKRNDQKGRGTRGAELEVNEIFLSLLLRRWIRNSSKDWIKKMWVIFGKYFRIAQYPSKALHYAACFSCPSPCVWYWCDGSTHPWTAASLNLCRFESPWKPFLTSKSLCLLVDWPFRRELEKVLGSVNCLSGSA